MNTPAVSVLGTGCMGSAPALALTRAGLDVAVRNRTSERAEALRTPSCAPMPDPADAVRSSMVVVVCVVDYPATFDVLSLVERDLRGKTVVQTSSGTPAQARELSSWPNERGCHPVEAAIMVDPTKVGTEACFIQYAGSRADYEAIRPVVRAFGGMAAYLGEDVTSPSAHEAVLACFIYGVLQGFLEGAAIAAATKVPMTTYLAMARGVIPTLDDELGNRARMIETRDYYDTRSALRVHLNMLCHTAATVEAAGVARSFVPGMRDRVARLVADGKVRDHIACLYDELHA